MDINLIRKVQEGDDLAFKSLFETYKQQVYKTSYLILHDEALAEDVVQDVFILVLNKINNLKDIQLFKSWLYKLTVNCSLDCIRKNKKLLSFFPFEFFNTIKAESKIGVPEDNLLTKESSQIIYRYINILSAKHKIPLILFYYNQFSIEEIADILDISQGTVKSRMHYGKKQLKKIIEQNNTEVINYEYR